MNLKRVFNLAITLAVLTALALSGVVWADDVANNIDSSVDSALEEVNLNVGQSQTVDLYIVTQNGDGKNGCNLTGQTKLTIKPTSSNTSVVTVSPDSITFTNCEDKGSNPNTAVKVTAISTGSANITFSLVENTTQGSFYLDTANFTVYVTSSDSTPPVITPIISGTLGNNGWYTSNVTVSWTVVDKESTVTSTSGCDSTTINSDTSETTLTCTATSAGGTASTSVTIKRDATPPTISANRSPAANTYGWNNTDVTVSFSCSDALSEVDVCPSDVTVSTEGAGQSVTGTATDKAGNSASATVSNINIDKTAPTISASLDKSSASTGWYNISTGAPTVKFTCSDATSGLAGNCPADYTFGEGKDQSYSQTIYDKAGNSASAGVSDIDVDLTAPTISASLDKSSASTGWYNISTGAPTVKFTCSDATSGLAGDCPADYTFGEGEDQSYSQTIYDNAGNSASAGVSDIDVDLTPPTISANRSPAANTYGWNNTDVTVSFSCSDALSGVDVCPSDVTVSTEGAGQSASGTATDKAGNSASATVSNINIDKTPPTITWSGGPANGGVYYFGSVPAAPTCSATDNLSGWDGACTVSGYSTAVGTHTLTATAKDKAGNTATETRTYTVLAWTLKGFYQPVDMNGVLNVVKGGSTVPLKFEIFAGPTELTDTASIYSLKYGETTCSANAVTDEIETVATGGTSLRYDWTAGQFIFNWKTPSTPGKCYRVTLTTQDGSTLQAFFKIK